jgi:hypothetical protein
MATNKSVKATPAGKYPLGHAKENKDASAYVNNGTSVADGMSGVVKKGNGIDNVKMSIGSLFKSQNDEVKTDGITMRGYGAATKGIKSRGPMA